MMIYNVETNIILVVLYTYLGSKHVGMGSEFARYCQTFAREGIKEIEAKSELI